MENKLNIEEEDINSYYRNRIVKIGLLMGWLTAVLLENLGQDELAMYIGLATPVIYLIVAMCYKVKNVDKVSNKALSYRRFKENRERMPLILAVLVLPVIVLSTLVICTNKWIMILTGSSFSAMYLKCGILVYAQMKIASYITKFRWL